MCYQEVESEQHNVSVLFFMKLEGDTISLYARVWPTMQGDGKILGPTVFGDFLARSQETQGEVVEGQHHSHTS